MSKHFFPEGSAHDASDEEIGLLEIARVVRERTGFPLPSYKLSTTQRRVARRMSVLGLTSLDAYLGLLTSSTGEAQMLVSETLISVTSFFRDPDAFTALGAALAARARADVLRCWVAGCATGEEAYSLTLLLENEPQRNDPADPYLVFASDLDEEALGVARSASYPLAALADIPTTRQQVGIDRLPDRFRISNRVRRRVVFARHDILEDPPFSRLDVMCCRNLLIYLNPDAQRQVLETAFHALRPGGLLLLGASESADVPSNGWEPVDLSVRLYRRSASSAVRGMHRPRVYAPPTVESDAAHGEAPRALGPRMADALAARYAPPSVLICADDEVAQIHGDLTPLLREPSGRAEKTTLDLLDPATQGEVRALVLRCRAEGTTIEGRRTWIQARDGRHAIRLSAAPLRVGKEDFVLVSFVPAPTPEATAEHEEPDAAQAAVVRELGLDLEALHGDLGILVRELDRARSALRALEEQHQSAMEELSSANEELQSANEELSSANEELRQRTIELDRAEALARLVADHIPGLVSYTDASGVCRFANQAYLAYFGRTSEQVVGRSMREVLGEELFGANLPFILAARQGTPQRFERTLTKPNGQVGHMLAEFVPDIFGGEVRGLYTLVIDVTPMKEAKDALATLNEELRRAHDRAEAASRAKSAFLANVSHEMRTPLNAVIGFAQLMERDASSARDVARVGKLVASAEHLLSIINDLLDLSKIEAGHLALRDDEFQRDDLIAKLANLVSRALEDKGLALRFEMNDIPEILCGDALRVRQALLNYVGNAIKFSARGTIVVRARVVERDGNALLVRFEVEDQGEGIDRELQNELFQPFGQLDGAGPHRGGTGLGLAITKRLSNAMGGDVGVISARGKGSTFWMTARLRQTTKTPSAVPAAPPSEPMSLAGHHVLLVDDNEMNQALLADMLESFGVQTTVASTGRVAVDLVRDHEFAIVLMDLRMPDMDGREATRHIRALEGRGDLPIIAVTASAFEEDGRACLAAGMNDFLPKPISMKKLRAMLERWLLQKPPTSLP